MSYVPFCGFLLKHHSQRNLRTPGIRPIGTRRRRTARSIRRNKRQRRSIETVFIRPAAGVVLRVEQVEGLKRQISDEALCKRQFFGEPRVDTIDLIQIQIADRLERHAAAAAATIQRTGNQRAGECISGDHHGRIYGPRGLQGRHFAQLPVIYQITSHRVAACPERRIPNETDCGAMTDVIG